MGWLLSVVAALIVLQLLALDRMRRQLGAQVAVVSLALRELRDELAALNDELHRVAEVAEP